MEAMNQAEPRQTAVLSTCLLLFQQNIDAGKVFAVVVRLDLALQAMEPFV